MQKLGNRLLVTPPPKHDESLTGYLVRLSDLNNYGGPEWILSAAGIYKGHNSWQWPSFVFRHSTDLEKLRELMGLSLPHLETLLYPPAEAAGTSLGTHLFYDSPVPQSMIHPQPPKVCPACLKESPYCRRIWDFKLVTCCPTHGCLLVDECQNCHKKLKWYRPATSFCECGLDLRKAHLQSTNDAAARLSGILCRLCGLSGSPNDMAIGEHNPLATLNLEYAVVAVLFLSSRIIHGHITGGGMVLPSNREVHEILLQTASIFENWPDGFHAFIESKRSVTRRSDRRNPRHSLDKLYSYLFNKARLSASELDFFRDEFVRYLELSGEKHRARPALKYITKKEAAKRLGMCTKSLRPLISEGKLKTVMPESWRINHHFIDAGSVENLKEELSQLIDAKRAAKWLGVSTRVIEQLTAAGCLAPARGPSVDGHNKLRFNQRDVINLMRNITSRLPKGDPLFTRCPDLRMAVQRFGPSNANLASKIKAIQAGYLFPLKPSVARLSPKMESLSLPF